MTPQVVYHWNRDDQVNALVSARNAESDTGFMMRLLALCTLPRTNPGNRDKYIRRKVRALYREGVEIPSDYLGVLYVKLDEAGDWQRELERELKAAGFPVDMNRTV